MCGIVGYVGKKQAAPIILEGLRHLEYRGYDSAGITVWSEGALETRKKKGKIIEGLGKLLEHDSPKGSLGLGHTRWATHGEPSDRNSHPHLDRSGRISIVHNGVIENFETLRDRLKAKGHTFQSETDTEVLAHLIGDHFAAKDGAPDGIHPLTNAVMNALREVIGTYGIAVMCADYPGVLVGARRGSPLIVGVGKDEHFLASDASAIVAHTRQVAYLNDYDVATIEADRFDVKNLGSDTARVQISQIEYNAEAAEKGRFAHFMLKEIQKLPGWCPSASTKLLSATRPFNAPFSALISTQSLLSSSLSHDNIAVFKQTKRQIPARTSRSTTSIAGFLSQLFLNSENSDFACLNHSKNADRCGWVL